MPCSALKSNKKKFQKKNRQCSYVFFAYFAKKKIRTDLIETNIVVIDFAHWSVYGLIFKVSKGINFVRTVSLFAPPLTPKIYCFANRTDFPFHTNVRNCLVSIRLPRLHAIGLFGRRVFVHVITKIHFPHPLVGSLSAIRLQSHSTVLQMTRVIKVFLM